jgi:peptidyl-prolyl cis-trans isomerase SurA
MTTKARTNRLLFTILLGTLFSISVTGNAATVERIVATVDGDAITRFELDAAVKTFGPELRKKYNVSGSTLRAKVLDKLIDEKVLANELTKSKIIVEPNEIDAFIDHALRNGRMSLDQFKQQLIQRGTSYEQYRKDLREQMVKNKFINNHVGRKINISERELKDYFDKHMDDFKSASSIHLGQISIMYTQATTEKDFKTIEKTALDIRSAAAKTSNFNSLASRYKSDKFNVEGTDLGVVQITDLQPQIAQVASMLDVGQVSNPIPTKIGIHLIKVLGRAKTSSKDFTAVREQVNTAIYDIKVKDALEGYTKILRRKATVDIKGL